MIIKFSNHHQFLYAVLFSIYIPFKIFAKNEEKAKILIRTFICEKNCISRKQHNYTASKKNEKEQATVKKYLDNMFSG